MFFANTLISYSSYFTGEITYYAQMVQKELFIPPNLVIDLDLCSKTKDNNLH